MVKYCAFWISLILLLLGCQPNIERAKRVAPHCLTSQSDCVVNLPQGNFSVLFDLEKVKPESEFSVTLVYQGEQEIERITGYIEGKNMFMGKIPLFFNPAPNQQINTNFVAPTMLGSCSQPDMRWRIWFKVAFANKQAQSFFIDFSTSLN